MEKPCNLQDIKTLKQLHSYTVEQLIESATPIFHVIRNRYLSYFTVDEVFQIFRMAMVEAYRDYKEDTKIASFRNFAWLVMRRKAVSCIKLNNLGQATWDNSLLSLNKTVSPPGRGSNGIRTLCDIIEDKSVKPVDHKMQAEDVGNIIKSLIENYMSSKYKKTYRCQSILTDYYVENREPTYMKKTYGRRFDNTLRNFKLYILKTIKKYNVKIDKHVMSPSLIDKLNNRRHAGETHIWHQERRRNTPKVKAQNKWRII